MGICLLPYEFDRIANHLIWVSSIWYGGLACQGTIAGSCWNLRCRAMTTRNSLEKLGCRALLMRYLMVIPLHLWFEAQGSTWRLVLVLPCSTNFIGQLAADFDHHNPWELMIVIGIIGISSQTNGWFSSRLRFFCFLWRFHRGSVMGPGGMGALPPEFTTHDVQWNPTGPRYFLWII
jgi:hypothetical protein